MLNVGDESVCVLRLLTSTREHPATVFFHLLQIAWWMTGTLFLLHCNAFLCSSSRRNWFETWFLPSPLTFSSLFLFILYYLIYPRWPSSWVSIFPSNFTMPILNMWPNYLKSNKSESVCLLQVQKIVWGKICDSNFPANIRQVWRTNGRNKVNDRSTTSSNCSIYSHFFSESWISMFTFNDK